MLSSQQIKSSSNSRVCKQWIHYGSPRAGRVSEFSGGRLNEPDFSKSRLRGKERGPGEGGGDLVIEILRMEFHRRGVARTQ